MSRRSVMSLVVAILCILTLAIAAATLTSPVQTGGGFGSGGSDEGGPNESGLPGGTTQIETPNIPYLFEILLAILILGIGIAVLTIVSNRRKAVRVFLSYLLIGILGFLIVQILTTLFSSGTISVQPIFGNFSEGPVGSDSSPSTPPLTLLLLIIAAIGVIAFFFHTGTREERPEDEEEEPDTVDTQAIGEAAGRAADRIEHSVDLDNEVYRAWVEMTELLDVTNPETTTPGEFAFLAIDAGLNEADVHELTLLFEDVRYGGIDPSKTYEERAISVFRRIESTYATDDQS